MLHITGASDDYIKGAIAGLREAAQVTSALGYNDTSHKFYAQAKTMRALVGYHYVESTAGAEAICGVSLATIGTKSIYKFPDFLEPSLTRCRECIAAILKKLEV